MTAAEMNQRPVRELWQDYLFVTKEMAKFLERQDKDMFNELLQQREKLQQMLDEAADGTYSVSPEGRQVFRQISDENQKMRVKLQYLLNTAKKQQTVSNAYENLGRRVTGRRLDRSL